MKIIGTVFAIALLCQAAPAAFAQMSHGSGHGDAASMSKTMSVKVTNAWARASAKSAKAGAAYLTLENAGDAADKLVSASTPVSGRAELHTHIKDGNVMRMREVQHIEVGPHAKVSLKPGGLHVMLMDLKGPLEKGSHFPLTLVFEKAGPVTVEVAIQAAGAMGSGGGKDGAHGHGGVKH
jgi:copper(I)-binding protein